MLKVLIGVSCSGKSTLAKSLGGYIVSRDAERLSLFGVYRMGSHKEERMITEIVKAKVRTALKYGDVILDNTHLKQEYLQEIIDDFDCDIEFIPLPLLAEDVLFERNRKRYEETGIFIPEEVIRKQILDYKTLTIPQNVKKSNVDKRINYKLNFDKGLCIVVDLDGTLALINGRNPYEGKKCASDKLNPAVAHIIDATAFKVYLVSGRKEEAREETEKWLQRYNVKYEKLLMRKTEDNRPDHVVKKELSELIPESILFVLDDRDSVVEMWRKSNIHCFQVNYGNF